MEEINWIDDNIEQDCRSSFRIIQKLIELKNSNYKTLICYGNQTTELYLKDFGYKSKRSRYCYGQIKIKIKKDGK